jgi:hypothetical protein
LRFDLVADAVIRNVDMYGGMVGQQLYVQGSFGMSNFSLAQTRQKKVWVPPFLLIKLSAFSFTSPPTPAIVMDEVMPLPPELVFHVITSWLPAAPAAIPIS